MSASRPDGRAADELRPIRFERDFTAMAAGSCLVSFGDTRVLCTASIDEDVPRWMKGKGKGWVTAEYSMLPGASPERIRREVKDGKPSGRTQEIQRLIGRSLRAVCDMTALGERQVIVDCDVLQADGGTRTASICGGYVALHDALSRVVQEGRITSHPLTSACAAISVGIVDGTPVLDLPYVEDSRAEVDMNVVMTSEGGFIEVQGTAEGAPYSRAQLDELLGLAEQGIGQIMGLQQGTLSEPPTPRALMRLLLATGNAHKAAELQEIVGPTVTVEARATGVEETGATFEENALLKARALVTASGELAVADDSGIEIDHLDGAPGIHSARWAGTEGVVARSLRELEGVPPAERTCRYVCAAAAVWPDGGELVVRGEVEGVVVAAPRGRGGFGYDPIVAPVEGDGRTFAEMSAAEKHAISHRARAFRALLPQLA